MPPTQPRLLLVAVGLSLAAAFLAALGACGGEEPDQPPVQSDVPYDATGRLLVTPTRKLRENPPNLVVLVIDTLRKDAVAVPGEDGGLMPYVTSLGKQGLYFRDAVAPCSWTVPSMASLFTGLLPSVHGNDNPAKQPRLMDAVTTYSEILRETHGYETAAYVAGPWLQGDSSLLQGFTRGSGDFALRGSKHILEGFRKKRDKTRPFFLLLHTFEAHDPYGEEDHPWPKRPEGPGPHSDIDPALVVEPWEITRHFLIDRGARLDLMKHHGREVTRKVMRYTWDGWRDDPRPDVAADLRTAYTEGVRWVDTQVRSTVEQLEAWGLLENTVLVITSDHGEAFGEHGMLGHARQLYDELVHIPLVMHGPAPFDGGRIVSGGVGLHDVLPTFLDYIGGEPLTFVQGRSFLPLLRGESEGRPVFSEEWVTRDNTQADVDRVVTSVRSPQWKYILTYDRLEGTVVEEAFDIVKDPGELVDLAAGSGRIGKQPFDAAFCRAIEQARDRIWGSAESGNGLGTSPYGGGRAQVTSKRPVPCGK